MPKRTKDRVSDRHTLRSDLDAVNKEIDAVEKQLSTCSTDEYLTVRRKLNALRIKQESMNQRLTCRNHRWTNEQSYEPNITIVR
jgi:hypothetical protein